MSKVETYKVLGTNQTEVVVAIDEVRITSFFENKIIFCRDKNNNEMVAKFSRNENKTNHEYIGYKLVEEAGIPTVKTIGKIKDQNAAVGLLTFRIRGGNLYTSKFENAKQELGSTVKKLHDNTRWSSSGDSPQNSSYYEERIAQWVKSPALSRVNISALLKLTQTLFSSTADQIEHQVAVFLHHDLHDDQVIIADKKLYLIDFEEWKVGHSMQDLGIYLYHNLRTRRPEVEFEQFIEGYTEKNKLTENDKSSLAFFLLFNGLKTANYYSESRVRELGYATEYLQRSIDYIDREKIWKM